MRQTEGRVSTGTADLGEQTASDPTRGHADPGGLRVLLVDAHTLVLRFMVFAFTSNGCVIHSAQTADDALQLLSSQQLDLVVADVELPGLSAAELLQASKQRQPAVPVVLTSTAAAAPEAAALRDQVYDCLKQPFSAEDVQRLIGRVTQDRRQRRTGSRSAGPGSSTEGLARIGDAALQVSDTVAFVEEALDHAVRGLGGDAALVLLRDEEGHVTVTPKGERTLVNQLLDLLNPALETLYASGDGQTIRLSRHGGDLTALAAAIPGPRKVVGVLCLGRHGQGAEGLDDASALLPAYARVIGVSLQKLLLTENVEGNVIDTISSFVVALEAKDVYLKGHSARVSLYVGETAKIMGLPPAQVAMARRAGVLHDLGKLVLNDAIYRKPGALTYEGSALMREHPASGASILKPLRFLAHEAEAIRRHHERYDGTGYPDGLKGEQIPLAARLIAVADSFDDMTSDRPYRTPRPIELAVQEIVRHAGTQFDPAVTEAFARIPLARLTEIARFYENRTESPAERAERAARPASALAAASKRLVKTKGWSSGHLAGGERRADSKAGKVIGIARGTSRRQAHEA